jgi:hypothetical protein
MIESILNIKKSDPQKSIKITNNDNKILDKKIKTI